MVKHTVRGLVVKRPGVLSKVQMLTLVLGVGGLFPSSKKFDSDSTKSQLKLTKWGLFISKFKLKVVEKNTPKTSHTKILMAG